jgi:hypothetical protein
MSERAEIEFGETGGDALIAQLQHLRDSTHEVKETLEGAFAFRVLERDFMRISQAAKDMGGDFGAVARAGSEAAEMIGKGFILGGPVGAALGAAGWGILQLGERWKEEAEEAKKAAEETKKHAEEMARAEEEALKRIEAETKKLELEERSLQLQRAEGITEAQARAKAELESVSGSRDASNARLGDLRKELDEQVRLRDEAAAKLELLSQGRASEVLKQGETYDAIETARAIRAEQDRARARIAEIEAKQSELVAANAGSAQAVRNATKAIDLAADKDELDEQKKAEEEKKKAREEAAKKRAQEREQEHMAVLEALGRRYDAELKKQQEQAARSIELQGLAEKRAEEQETKDARAAAESAAKAAHDFHEQQYEQEQTFLRQSLESRKANSDKEDEIVSASIQREIALRQKEQAAITTTVGQLTELALTFADTEQRKTKAQYEEEAKRAAIQAAVMTAEALVALYYGAEDKAVEAGLAAAEFAAIAGGNIIASSAAGGGSSSSTGASASGSSNSSSAGGGFGRSSSGQGGGGATTIVIGANNVLLTKGDIARAVQSGLNESQRTR